MEDFLGNLDLLYGNSRDFVFFMRKIHNDYEYVYTNRSAEDMLGRNVIGESVLQVLDADTAKFILEHYDRAVSSNKQAEFEDYAYFHYSVHKHETTINPVSIWNDTYVLAVTKEISFERDIQDKYLFMRSIFFKTFLSTVLVKNDGTLIEANPTFLNHFGLNGEDIQGKRFTDLSIFTEEAVTNLNYILSCAEANDRFETQVLKFIGKDHKEYHLSATFSPIYRGNEVISVFIIFQDVTEYVIQQKQLEMTTHGLNSLRRAMDQAAELTITNIYGEIIEVNDRFIERTGYTKQELLGKTHNILNSGYHSKEFFKNLWKTISSGKVWRGEIRNRTKFGETYWVDTTIIPLTNQHGELFQYLTIHFNVSEKKKMMIELRDIERTFRLITENTNDFIVVLNRDGEVNYSSPSYIRNLGYTEHEMVNIQYEDLIHSDSITTWNNLIKGEVAAKEGNIELMLLTKDGETVWTEGNYTLVYDDHQSVPSQIIMVSREITERKEREDSLMFLAYHDSLTQLPNRRYLQKEFPLFIEQANVHFESFAVLYVDGDNFKKVNDTYGHDTGDIYLMNFGKALSSSVRKNDIVVRIGGDEFIIIVRNLSRDQDELKFAIKQVLQNIHSKLAEGWTIGGIEFDSRASVGIATYPYHGYTFDELVDYADKDLYRAKNTNKR